MSKPATNNSTLTYTLGARDASNVGKYYNFLVDLASFFTVDQDTLKKTKQLNDYSWLINCIKQFKNAKERLWGLAFLNLTSFKPDSDHDKALKEYQKTLLTCLNLADEIIMPEIILNEWHKNIIQPLEILECDLSEIEAKLQALQQKSDQQENDLAVNNAIAKLFAPYRESLTHRLRSAKDYTNQIKNCQKKLWDIAIAETQNADEIWQKLATEAGQEVNEYRQEICDLRCRIRSGLSHHIALKPSAEVHQYNAHENLYTYMKTALDDYREYKQRVEDEQKKHREIIPAIKDILEYVAAKSNIAPVDMPPHLAAMQSNV